MGNLVSAKSGGAACAIISRKRAIDRYYASPSVCKHCGKVIEVRPDEKVSWTKKKKFCDRVCAARFNNPARGVSLTYKCIKCGIEVVRSRSACGKIKPKRKYCDRCLYIVKEATVLARFRNTDADGYARIMDMTKGDFFKRSKSARSSIRRLAVNVYKRSGGEDKCFICGYSYHIEVCHKKPVSRFRKDTLIKEINSIGNLVGLCRNHHWELDAGILKI